MARKPTPKTDFVLFDVIYADGSQRSNRKVPAAVVEGLDGDASTKAFLEQQDRTIAERSGLPPMEIRSYRRSRRS